MNSLVNEYHELLSSHDAPCVSLYQPTHRHHPDKDQDPIRFRNLLRVIEGELGRLYSTDEARPLLDRFYALSDDRDFWNRSLDGLAVLASRGAFRVYKLQRPVPELAVVADSFHTKPLMRIIQSADRYQILGLNRSEIRLFEGNRDAVDEVELDERVPRTITDALGEELTDAHVAVAPRATGAGRTPIRQGSGTKADEVAIDSERFFRAVDRAILEYHSKPSGLPLILAALPEHHALFRRVSHNPQLAQEGIDIHPDALAADGLRERAWQLVAPYYLQRLQGLIDQFAAAKARGAADEDLRRVGEAAAAGRVATLLIDADRHVPGRFDADTGRIEVGETSDLLAADILDDLGERVLKTGGEVVVVPAERMPAQTGVAAIYRY
jgi:hypothetical protein